ncbi:Hsp70 family protein [Actinoplanes sp. Pm04-4]|uniref:Hsp70 family protein n=1 Tax=Paractinoplanes pyxinae TaxID=2997416 RepID=A0ABT4BBY9_9ACTN|nr:Hsp70 family protein [Actinoplanes pyxinae]MCY1144002.1 Hsp70 family protein [Actinoplanes pyxinae]
MLPFGGAGELSSAVHVAGSIVLIGAAAWQQAGIEPDGFVVSPLRAGTGQVRAGGRDVEVADLVTATLRHVGAEAAQVTGEPISQVRLVVPSGWGPQRRNWLRRAAGNAGLPVIAVVAAPVAALHAVAGASRPGQVVLVIDVGNGCETTVLQYDADGLSVLSVLTDPDAGGNRIDQALLAATGAGSLDDLPVPQRWPALAAVRTAQQALEHHPAVTVPLPGGQPPAAVSVALLREVAQPTAERVATLATEALGNADLSVDRVHAVYAIGGACPPLVDVVAAKLGALPQVLDRPASAAVLGAAQVTSVPARDVRAPALPPLRRLVSLSLPALVSLVLYAHFVFSAEFYNGTPQSPRPYFYVLAAWGELTVASVLAVVALLQAAPVLTAVRHEQQAARSGGDRLPNQSLTSGLGAAIAGGVAVASLYAVVAAVYMGQPTTALLKWALVPVLPVTAAALVLLALVWRHRRPPERGWDPLLSFPVSSVLAGAAGSAALALSWHGRLSALDGWSDLLAAAGALLVAVALACTVTRHAGLRVAVSVLLSLLLLIISRAGPSVPAVVYAVAVAAWWAQRAWTVLRLPVVPG